MTLKHFENIQKLSDYYGLTTKHPLIDVRKYGDIENEDLIKNEPVVYSFYTISFVTNFNGSIEINKTKFEGQNGVLHFIEPDQVYTCNSTNRWEGYQVLIHPQIFKEHFSHKEISTYDIFSYEVNESLLLTEEEKQGVESILSLAWHEFNQSRDAFSIQIILSYISTLLNLAERFYARQFESRRSFSNQLSLDFQALLRDYYRRTDEEGVRQPTVSYFASKLNVTPNYLSDTIRHDQGKAALAVIQDFIIERAKDQLTNTRLTVSEISFMLGFEYPNYFSRLFKRKTNLTPSDYRLSVKRI